MKSNNNKRSQINEFSLPPRNFEIPYQAPRSASSNVTTREKLYISILDSVYESSPLLCTLYDSWVKDARELYFVDAVEVYSVSSYGDQLCGMKTLTFDDPPEQFPINRNPSCYIMLSMFRMFLERSDANWFMVVSDSAYVNIKNLENFIGEYANLSYFKAPIAKGQCVELRDYFQIFAPSSGAIFSRATISQIVNSPKKLEIACEIEISAFEAAAHALDEFQIFAIHNHEPRFLGQSFASNSDIMAFETGVFTDLKQCSSVYTSPRVCYTRAYHFNDLVVWAGAGSTVDKIRFLEKAKSWMELAPANLGFMYNSYQSDLCIFKPKN